MRLRGAFQSPTSQTAVIAALIGGAIAAASLTLTGTLDVTGVITNESFQTFPGGPGFRLGSDAADPAIVQGTGSPDGASTRARGSLFLRTDVAQLWQNLDASTDWWQVGTVTPTTCASGEFVDAIGADGVGQCTAVPGSVAPTAASTGFNSWWYQWTGSTTGDGASGPYIQAPTTAGANEWSARAKTAPATPYAITLRLRTQCPLASVATTVVAYVGWGEAATGTANKGYLWAFRQNQSGNFSLRVDLTNATTVSAAPTISGQSVWGTEQWVRIADDGTTATVSVSPTGDDGTFVAMLTTTKAGSFLGATGYNYVLYGTMGTASTCTVAVTSYSQT